MINQSPCSYPGNLKARADLIHVFFFFRGQARALHYMRKEMIKYITTVNI
jgi:hypothetical protein